MNHDSHATPAVAVARVSWCTPSRRVMLGGWVLEISSALSCRRSAMGRERRPPCLNQSSVLLSLISFSLGEQSDRALVVESTAHTGRQYD
jgi:hypothetical protein